MYIPRCWTMNVGCNSTLKYNQNNYQLGAHGIFLSSWARGLDFIPVFPLQSWKEVAFIHEINYNINYFIWVTVNKKVTLTRSGKLNFSYYINISILFIWYSLTQKVVSHDWTEPSRSTSIYKAFIRHITFPYRLFF